MNKTDLGVRTEEIPLASRDHWDRINRSIRPRSRWSRFSRWLLGGALTYHNFLMMQVLEEYLGRPVMGSDKPRKEGGRCIEIGCAPGHVLLSLRTRFGLEPFGVEYTESGYAATIREFEAAGVSTGGIILGDIENPEFRKHYKESFEVVFSQGFVEHFSNPEDIISYHMDLLKPGGLLVVTIPNLSGSLYHFSSSFLDPTNLSIHNLEIMRDPAAFRDIFRHQPLVLHYCDYLGTVDLSVLIPPGKLLLVGQVLRRIQNMMNILLRWSCPWWRPSNRFVSPFLLYIGTKHH